MAGNSTGQGWGGDWTVQKLGILEEYLNAYTTALKKKPFKLLYTDAFAGTGSVEFAPSDDDARTFIRGSASRALNIRDKPFDRLIFIEQDPDKCRELADRLGAAEPRVEVVNDDANSCLSEKLQVERRQWRGVLFLDPFATEVKWATIERICRFQALDTWILFPVSAVARMLPTSKRPEDISRALAASLTTIFGDESWRKLYSPDPQLNFLGDERFFRDSGIDGIVRLYKDRLRALFGSRLLEQSATLKNSRNSPLFEFLFCAGHPKGADLAHRIARHLIALQE